MPSVPLTKRKNRFPNKILLKRNINFTFYTIKETSSTKCFLKANLKENFFYKNINKANNFFNIYKISDILMEIISFSQKSSCTYCYLQIMYQQKSWNTSTFFYNLISLHFTIKTYEIINIKIWKKHVMYEGKVTVYIHRWKQMVLASW